ncbi:MAG: nucleoside-diphosphate kinase [Acidimicrobiales bacterium]
MDRTLFIVKPDGVERGLVGAILGRIEAKQLRFVAAELRTIDLATAERHYADHVGKEYYEKLVAFITQGPSLVTVIEGPEDTWQVVRGLMGATNAKDAAPGTIRGDLAIGHRENLVHGSDSVESAQREIAIFFPHLV